MSKASNPYVLGTGDWGLVAGGICQLIHNMKKMQYPVYICTFTYKCTEAN